MPYGAKTQTSGWGTAQLELGAGVHTLAGSAGVGQTECRAYKLRWERTASAEWRSVAGRPLSAMANGPHTVGANRRESVPSPPLALQAPSNAHDCWSLSRGCWQRRNMVGRVLAPATQKPRIQGWVWGWETITMTRRSSHLSMHRLLPGRQAGLQSVC